MKRYISLQEDRRNVLPRTFDKWMVKEFKTIEGFLNNYDFFIEDYYPEDMILSTFNISEDDYENDDEYKAAISQYQLELLGENQDNVYDNWLDKYYDFKFPMTIYRVIDLKAKSIEDIANIDIEKEFRKGIGVYWTDGEWELEAYWSKGGKSFTIRALVYEKDINWKDMLFANMDPSMGEGESEIRLEDNIKIKLTGIAEGPTTNDKDFEPLNVQVRT